MSFWNSPTQRRGPPSDPDSVLAQSHESGGGTASQFHSQPQPEIDDGNDAEELKTDGEEEEKSESLERSRTFDFVRNGGDTTTTVPTVDQLRGRVASVEAAVPKQRMQNHVTPPHKQNKKSPSAPTTTKLSRPWRVQSAMRNRHTSRWNVHVYNCCCGLDEMKKTPQALQSFSSHLSSAEPNWGDDEEKLHKELIEHSTTPTPRSHRYGIFADDPNLIPATSPSKRCCCCSRASCCVATDGLMCHVCILARQCDYLVLQPHMFNYYTPSSERPPLNERTPLTRASSLRSGDSVGAPSTAETVDLEPYYRSQPCCSCQIACLTMILFLFYPLLGHASYFILRRLVIQRYHIEEGFCTSLTTALCCGMCSTCQVHHELLTRGEWPGQLDGPGRCLCGDVDAVSRIYVWRLEWHMSISQRMV